MPLKTAGGSALEFLADPPGLQFVAAHATDVENLKYIGSSLGVDTVVLQVDAVSSGRAGTSVTILDTLTDQGSLSKAIAAVRTMSLRASAVLRLRLLDGSPLSALTPGNSTAGVLAFFNALKTAAARFCHFAERHTLDTVFLFPGLLPSANAHEPPMTYRQQWADLYQACSDAYGGNIVYVSVLAKVGPKGSLWAMDWSLWPFIGVNLYPSAATSSLTADALYKDFTQTPDPYATSALGSSGVFPALADLSKSYGKAIVVNECGVRPIAGAQTRPWDANRQGSPNPALQASWWDAMGACWADYADTFAGLCVYTGDHAASHPYGVRDLPAQSIISARVSTLRASVKNNQAVRDRQRAGPVPSVSVRRPRAAATSIPATPSSPVTVVRYAGTPSGLSFLPDGSLLYASHDGACLFRVDLNGHSLRLSLSQVSTLGADSGVMGVAVDPAFSYNGFVYVFQSARQSNHVVRYTMAPDGSALSNPTIILAGIPNGTINNGGALAFGPDEKLYIGAGDTGDSSLPQDLRSLGGKILRINRDGSTPSDNSSASSVWSIGHCSPTGITWDDSGTCWAIERGAANTTTKIQGRLVHGTDKINRIVKGGNYGWPLADGAGIAFDAYGRATLPPSLAPFGGPWSPGGVTALSGRLFFGTSNGLWTAQINADGTLSSLGEASAPGARVGPVSCGPDNLVWFGSLTSISKVAVASVAPPTPTTPRLPRLAATQSAAIPPNIVFQPTVPNLVTDSNGRGLRSLAIDTPTTVLTSPAITREGKYYFEFTIRNETYPYLRVGVANARTQASGTIGKNAISLGYDGHVLYYNDIACYPPPLSDRTFFKTGDVVGVALDWSAGLAWFRRNGEGWFNLLPHLQDPAHAVGGVSCRQVLDANGFSAAASMQTSGQSVVVNLGQAKFTFSPPSGFRSPVTALVSSAGSLIPSKAPNLNPDEPIVLGPLDEPVLDDSPGARARRRVAERLKLYNVGPDTASIQATIPAEVDFTLPTPGASTAASTTPIAWPFASVFINGFPTLQLDPAGQYIAGGRLANISNTGNAANDIVANSLPANAANGFLYIPTVDGKPTGTPNEVIAGAIPIVYDVVGKNLYAYVVNTWVLIGGAAAGGTTGTPSPSGTTLTSTSGQIVDAQGHVWTLRDTLTSTTTSPNGTVINAGSTGQIVDNNGNVWTVGLLTPTPSPTSGGPSPDGLTLTTTSGTIVDNDGNIWSLNYSPLPTPAPTPNPSPLPSPSPSPSPSPGPSPAPSPTPSPAPSGAVPNYKGRMNLIGVNISGAEYGTAGTGAAGTDYTYPSPSEISYFASKGCNIIRVPFNLERLQPTQNGALSNTELGYIQQVVSAAANNNTVVLLDPHNYGSAWGNLIGSAGTPVSSFANFWGAVAQAFNNVQNVMFGLMNEPNQQTASDWAQANIAAISAIRQTGAANQIMVPGTSWTGAWTWVSSGNASAINPTTMADSNIAFEVHQYLDSDGSGTNYGPITDPQIGANRLTAVTQWAQSVGASLFLGEVGVPSDSQSLTALQNMLTYMEQNSNVWQGLSYWTAGQWIGTYAFSVEPTNGQDTPQMGVLDQFVPGGTLATGYVAPGG